MTLGAWIEISAKTCFRRWQTGICSVWERGLKYARTQRSRVIRFWSADGNKVEQRLTEWIFGG